jgi:hypothetical protein
LPLPLSFTCEREPDGFESIQNHHPKRAERLFDGLQSLPIAVRNTERSRRPSLEREDELSPVAPIRWCADEI